MRSIFGMHSFVCAAFVFIIISSQTQALTLETFEGTLTVICEQASVPKEGSVASSGSIGGTLTMRCRKISPGSGPAVIARSTGFQRFLHSQDTNARGTAELEWDGTLQADTTKFDGLPSLDLVQDNGTAIRFNNVSFDCPSSGMDVHISMTVYDARDPSGNRNLYFDYQLPCWSTFDPANPQHVRDVRYGYHGSYPTPEGVNLTIPFADFIQSNPATPADITKVGAIQVMIAGNSAAVDLSFSSIGTDGTCPNVPDIKTGIACTPTPTPTPTVTPTPPPLLIESTPSCVRVPPTAEMKSIGATLLRSTSTISNIIRADLARATKSSRCKNQVRASELQSSIARYENAIRAEIRKNILRSVAVCGADCIKVSFLEEVTRVKTMIRKYGLVAARHARTVVSCAQDVRNPNGRDPSASTLGKIQTALQQQVNVSCRVCK